MTRVATTTAAPAVSVPPAAEHLLQLIGAESPLAADILGDLAEEHALRQARDGEARARWWYVREAARAVPHLLWSAVRSGTPDGRLRLAVLVGLPAAISVTALAALWLRPGPAATLVPGYGNADGTVVVSDVEPVRIPIRVLDAKGRPVADSGVRFALVKGRGVTVREDGGVRCARTTEATVRATYAGASTRFTLSCQPIDRLWMSSSYNVAIGGAGTPLRIGGWDYAGNPVTRVSADMRTRDDSIAIVERDRIVGQRPGRTFLDVHTQSRAARALVTVFERVPSLDAARPDQRFVVTPVRLDPGEWVRWHLAPGSYRLTREPDARGAMPRIAVHGARCLVPPPAPERTYCEVGRGGATVELSHPADAAAPVEGVLWVARDGEP